MLYDTKSSNTQNAKFKIATWMASMVWNMTLLLLVVFVWQCFLISFPGDWQLNIRQQTWSSFSSLSCYALLQAQTQKKLASWKGSNNSAPVTLLPNIHRGNLNSPRDISNSKAREFCIRSRACMSAASEGAGFRSNHRHRGTTPRLSCYFCWGILIPYEWIR